MRDRTVSTSCVDRAGVVRCGRALVSSGGARLAWLVAAWALAAPASAQFITTVAGRGPAAGPANAVSVPSPQGVAVDATGNVYVAAGYHVVRWDRATDSVTVVAGNGSSAIAPGDGGPAVAGGIDPHGLAVTPGGDIYIADSTRVRKVDHHTGVITTVAGVGSTSYFGDGGAATSAGLTAWDVARDGAGNLYIADRYNYRVRRVAAATGIITTVAGNGSGGSSGDGGPATSAQIGAPVSIAFDSVGRLLIGDTDNKRVRRVDLATGIISTVAGNGACGTVASGTSPTAAPICWPMGLAVDGAGNVWIQGYDHTYRIDAGSGLISPFAGGGGVLGDGGPATSARLSYGSDVASGPDGSIFITDSGQDRVRRVAPGTGIISTLLGKAEGEHVPAVSALVRPDAVAAGPSGELYIVESEGSRVRRVDPSTREIVTVMGTDANQPGLCGWTDVESGTVTEVQLCLPTAAVVNSSGDLYVFDSGANRVLKRHHSTGIVTRVAGGTYGFGGDGGPALQAAFGAAYGLAVGTRLLYISDTTNNRVRKVDLGSGIVTTVAGNGGSGFSGDGGLATAAELRPRALAVDGSGNVFVADSNNGRIRRIDVVTGIITTVAGNGSYSDVQDGALATSGGLGYVDGLAINAAGNLLAPTDGRIRFIDHTTWIISTVAGSRYEYGFAGDGGLAADARFCRAQTLSLVGDALYVGDSCNWRVRRIGTSAVGPVMWHAPAEGGTQVVTVSVVGASAWSASSNAAWLTANPAGQSGSSTVTLTAEANAGATARSTIVTVAGQQVAVTQGVALPELTLDRTSLIFGALSSGAALTAATSPQVVRLTKSGVGTVSWTASSSVPWLQVTPASGSGSHDLTVSVVSAGGLPTSGTVTGAITITPMGGDLVGPVQVQLAIKPAGTATGPLGVIDTPINNATGIVGAVPFTGWALDDVEVLGVAICRAAVSGETAPLDVRCGNTKKIYVGDAVFIDGARPDVEAAYPAYPLKTRAGWGFMVLTNMLPNVPAHHATGGVGSFTFTFYAKDADAHMVLLGSRTIACANHTSTLPFGTLDTPGQGAVVSGAAYANFGWALTPLPKTIPVDGSTIGVFVDGVSVGHPAYGYPRADIQALFPGYNNTNTAVGARTIDTTALANGLHTISWSICDDAAACTGIGSRYFTVSNGAVGDAAALRSRARVVSGSRLAVRGPRVTVIDALPADTWPVEGRRGWRPDAATALVDLATDGTTLLGGEEVDRLELRLRLGDGETVAGYLRANGQLRALPPGASLDANTGLFTWAPGVGFVGRYHLVFVRSIGGQPIGRREVRVTLAPKGTAGAHRAPGLRQR